MAPSWKDCDFVCPRLSAGGYISVHDFNNDQYKGAHKAVLEFCRAEGSSFTPLPDSGGTAVLRK